MASPYKESLSLDELGKRIKEYVARQGRLRGDVFCNRVGNVMNDAGTSCDAVLASHFFGFPVLSSRTVVSGVRYDSQAEFNAGLERCYDDLQTMVYPCRVMPQRVANPNEVYILPEEKFVMSDAIIFLSEPLTDKDMAAFIEQYDREIAEGGH